MKELENHQIETVGSEIREMMWKKDDGH